jgi:hypothetical protein
MKPLGFALSLALAAFVAACSIESLHPLADPADIHMDERLFGSWIAKGAAEGNQHRLFIRKQNGKLLRATWLAYRASGQMEKAELEIAPTVLAGQTYASIRILKAPEESTGSADYVFVKYLLDSDGKLTIWNIDFRTAVERRELTAVRGQVIDATESLRKLITRRGDEVLGDVHFRFTQIVER